MSSFDEKAIEGLISKAKELRLSRLRVADGDGEVCIELPRSVRVAGPVIGAATNSESAASDVLSQFVGYFRPSVEPGAQVVKDSVVGVVESLGLPNDIVAPASGKVSAFTVSDGDAVEYGTVIARIET